MNCQSHLCILKPIGKCTNQNDETVFRIARQYTKALKQLSHFSHLIMFTHNKIDMKHYVCRAHHVDENQGIIITDNTNIPDNTIIYDIKPYIPCEDSILQNNHKHREERDRIHPCDYHNELNAQDLPEQIDFESKGIFRYRDGMGTLIMNDQARKELAQSQFARVFWWFNQFEDKRYRNTLVCNPP